MLQRGLAILLSVCMLAGITGDTVYAMGPQTDVGTVNAVQNVSDTGEILELSTEDEIGDSTKEEGETSEKELSESGDGTEGDVVGSEATDDDSTEDGDGATGDVADNEDNIPGDIVDSEGDTEQSGTEDDENMTESEGGSDNDAAVNEDEADAEDQSKSETEDMVDESEAGVSVQSIKDEELILVIDDPQIVMLAEDEKQWLSFTAPEDGVYRFYSTSEEESYQDRYVYLFHEKSDNQYAYFDYDYASGQNGNFTCTYRMQKNETVYLLVGTSYSSSGTFMVNAEKVEAEDLTVAKTDGGYTLQSDSYRLNLIFAPSYRTVETVMELQQADGSALNDGSYRVHYTYSYDDVWGDKSSYNHTITLSSSKYQGRIDFTDMAAGGELVITGLQICDDFGNVLAVLRADERAISVNTLTTDKQGVLTQVTAEDTSIEVRAEMTSDDKGRLRYRKKNETEWSYKSIFDYWGNFYDSVTLPAMPDTDYVIELLAEDEDAVYDAVEIRTKAFAASDIKVKVTDITTTKATVKVTIGTYTGNDQYIQARLSYTDCMGAIQTSTGEVNVDRIASDSINLSLSNLAAGTEYKDLEVELNHTDSDSMEYAAYKEKVSFTTAVSALTAEQIDVTVALNEQDYSYATVRIALPDVPEEDPYYGYDYDYIAKYRVVGSKYWWKSTKGVLAAGYDDSDHDEWELFSLVGDTEYEVLVMMDGVVKKTTFTTKAAAVAATVEVKPLAQGVQVTATLTGALSKDDVYYFSVRYYNQNTRSWDDAYQRDDNCLTMENNWESTAVFSGAFNSDIRPNVEYDWKIVITDYNESMRVYDKILSLKTKSETGISLRAENITYTTADIKAVFAGRDASIQEGSANLYYREKGRNKWISCDNIIDIPSNEYDYEDDYIVYLDELKEDTEYEVKLALYGYPEDILAQTTFRTFKDTRSLSVSVDNCRYTSAQVNWIFDSGINESGADSYICIYSREKGIATWTLVNEEWVWTSRTGKADLTDLKEGTSYEVLVELKDGYSTVAGESVVRDAKTEFTTAVIDHELKAEPVESETDATSVTFDMQLSRKAGALENRARAVVTLQSADGDSVQSKTINFNKDNQYKAKVKVSDLLPNTKYTVSAELYESDNNEWSWLKNFTLGEITTAEAKAPTALTISETKFALNKGTSKKLTVTAQPQDAAVGLTWTSSDAAVATVGKDGTVMAHKAGEADITVSAASAADDGKEKVSAVSHVTVRDYEILVKDADGSYDSIPIPLSKSQKRTLVVYDSTAEQDLTGVVWSSSNPNVARISAGGLLEPQNYGQAYITARTGEDIVLKSLIKVVNEIQGFSITRPETDNDSYQAIRTAEAVYQVAAGETYQVGCVLSPAYTDLYDTSVSMPGDRFTWSSDNNAVTVKVSEYGNKLTEITIPESVSGLVKVSAVMKDEEYKDKNYTITLNVLKKPEVEELPATYTWLDYSSKLKDVGLPENWQWKEQDTLIYETGRKIFTARYAQTGYYPYETGVVVYAEKIENNLSVIGDYSTNKKAYVVKKEAPLKVGVNALRGNIPASLYEQSALAPTAKDASKVSVSAPDATGYYSVTASVKGTYTVSVAVSLKKAAFEKKDGQYVLIAGAKVKDTTASVKFITVDSALIHNITFAVAADSPEKVTLSKDGTIEYEITAANADTKNKERVIYLDVTAADTDGNKVENPNINYAVSDTAVVKLKKQGTDRLVLTIPKGADGLAKIVATAKDDLGYSTELTVRVKDHTPRVITFKPTVNENESNGKQIAYMVLPYLEEDNDQVEKILLVETDSKEDMKEVAGLQISYYQDGGEHEFYVGLRVSDQKKITKKGNLKYYLAITTKAYGGTVFIPVQIKIETGMPKVSLKQSNKVNVFYTDTTHLSSYDAVSMGLVELSSAEWIESVRWVAGQGTESEANTEFVIDQSSYTNMWKNGKRNSGYMIQQHKPTLNSNKKPSDAAIKGNIYVRLRGYNEEIKLPFTIQTVYKKPKLKVADYKVCPALGEIANSKSIYTNAAKINNYLLNGSSSVWRGYSDIICADEEIEVENNYSSVKIYYNGTKDKKTQFTFYSDYWYESLTVPVKVKVAKSKVKLSPAIVTLNTAYPSETTQTEATTAIYNAATGTYVDMADVRIEGANSKAQELLDKSLLNINVENSNLLISVNYAKAMGSTPIKPGSYKFKLTPYLGDTTLNSVTLAVKIIDKEATVKVKTKGTIDLMKLSSSGNSYDCSSSNYVTVTPAFKNLDSSYRVEYAELEGAYKDLFRIYTKYSDGVLRIVPNSIGNLKAGKSYQLSVTYTVKDSNGAGGEKITLTSNTFTIKPKQSVPKVTTSTKPLPLYTCAKGESRADAMYLYVPHDYKKGYYAVQNASGSLDVNRDGKADLMVKMLSTTSSGAQISVCILDADAIKATAKGVTYKIPVTVKCVGRDGVSKDASTTVNVVVKK